MLNIVTIIVASIILNAIIVLVVLSSFLFCCFFCLYLSRAHAVFFFCLSDVLFVVCVLCALLCIRVFLCRVSCSSSAAAIAVDAASSAGSVENIMVLRRHLVRNCVLCPWSAYFLVLNAIHYQPPPHRVILPHLKLTLFSECCGLLRAHAVLEMCGCCIDVLLW